MVQDTTSDAGKSVLVTELCRVLVRAGLEQVEVFDYSARQEQEINRLADTLEQYMDLDKTFACLSH